MECIYRRTGPILDKNEFAGVKGKVMGLTIAVENLEASQIRLCVVVARALAGELVSPICLHRDKSESTCPIPREFPNHLP